MCRKFKGNLRAIIPSLIGIFLIGISISILFYFLKGPSTAYPPSYYPWGREMSVLYNCEGTDYAPSILLELHPVSGTKDINVILIIRKWKEFMSNCDFIQIDFPGATYLHRHVLERGINIFPEIPIGTPLEDLSKLPGDWSIPLLPSQMEINSHKNIIKIYPKKIENFTGGIEFFWTDGYKKLGFSNLGFSLAFRSEPWVPNAQLHRIRNYTIRVWTPAANYALVSSIPQPLEFKLIGYHHFDIDIYKTDLVAIFENNTLSKTRDYYFIIFSTLLGIGLALVVGEIIGFINH